MSTTVKNEIKTVNARLDHFPRSGLSFAALLVIAISYVFSFYDITAIGVSLPSLIARFHLSGPQIALPLTTNLIGYMIGAYAFGNAADMFGRKKALVLTLGMLTIGSVLTAFSWNDASLSVFRFLTGLGIGSQITICATLLAELTPAKHRARYIQMNTIWAAVGDGVVAPFLGLLLVTSTPIGWRLVLAVGGLAIVPLGLILMGKLPESPRWLTLQGREDEAEKVVTQMEQRVRKLNGGSLPVVTDVPAEEPASLRFPTFSLVKHPYLIRLLSTIGFWIFVYIGLYGYLGYETMLLQKMGFSPIHSLLFTALGDLSFPIGALLAMLVVLKAPRKYLLFVECLLMGLGMVLIASNSTGWMIFTGAFLIGLMNMPLIGAGYTYTSEIFPTRARASAMSLADGVGHFGGVVAPFLILAILSIWEPRMTFWAMALCLVIAALVIGLAGLRTQAEPLTELAK